MTREEIDAACRLAKAAPRLLEALNGMVGAVSRLRMPAPCTKTQLKTFIAVVNARDRALAAIREARGE